MLIIACKICGSDFKTVKSNVARGGGIYCSRLCSNAGQRSLKENNLTCLHCKVEFYRRPSKLPQTDFYFCSRKCAETMKWRRRKSSDHYHMNGEIVFNKIEHTCATCKSIFLKKPSSTLQHCSPACKSADNMESYIKLWLEGKVSGNNGSNISKYVRRYMFKLHDNRCQKCGWNEINPVTGKIPLTVNHVDGNWENTVPSNLELFCPNCHSLTPNYGSLNIGNGRKHRRKLEFRAGLEPT